MATTRNPLTPAEIRRYYETRLPKYHASGKELRGPCPIHRGARDSLAVNLETGTWFCHSGCARGGSIFDFETALSGVNGKHAQTAVFHIVGRSTEPDRQITATYDYTDESGALLYQTVRYFPKDFKQRRPDARGGWIWNLKGARLVLYRLPAVVRAPIVFVVEGEKDADALNELGVVATTAPLGAGKWRAAYSELLRDKHVFVIPDADDKGRQHAAQVIASLSGSARSAALLELGGAKDASVWIERGGTLEALVALAEGAGPAPAPAGRTAHRGEARRTEFQLTVRDAGELYDADFPEPAPIVAPILYPGLTLLAGRAKVGKSWLALDLALALVQAEKFAGFLSVSRAQPVLYVSLEERPRQTRARLRLLTPPGAFLKHLKFIHELPALMAGGAAILDAELRTHPARVMVVDSLLGITKQAGRKGVDVLQTDYNIVNTLREVAERNQVALVLICHTRKAAGDYFVDLVQGTTGTTAAADAVWVLLKKGDGSGTLQVTGRDLEDRVYGLTREGPLWRIQGEGEEFTQGEERREVLDLLRENGAMKPMALARALQKRVPAMQKLLGRMVNEGLVVRQKYGQYQVLGSEKSTPESD